VKLKLATHGGHAAGIHLQMPARVVETDALPGAAAAELARLVAAATSEEAKPTDHSGTPAPDGMSYTITVEDSGHSTVLSQSDTTMTRPFAALLAWLQEHTTAQ
jgi:hypothetical protein